MLRHSWNGPAFDAPSPKNDTATPPLPSICAARPADARTPPRDYPVGSEHADAEIGDVHRPALALAVAGLPPVKLGHHAVEVGALGDAVAVAAMRRDDPVALIERGADTDRDRLLADVAMHDAVDLAVAVIGRGAFLETADRQHLAQHLALLVGRQVRRLGAVHRGNPSGRVGAFHDVPAPAGWPQVHPV